jgi:hypothetical protein
MPNVIALRSAQALGHVGLLPFFALAVLAWLPSATLVGGVALSRLAVLALVAYAAVIVSFLGAVHWGLVLAAAHLDRATVRRSLLWGVTPSLLGWLALLMLFIGIKPWLVFAFLIGDLLLCRLMDGALLPRHPAIPDWYLGLRTRLTAGASLALALALAATF